MAYIPNRPAGLQYWQSLAVSTPPRSLHCCIVSFSVSMPTKGAPVHLRELKIID
jgi:hypothetical protein